MKRDPEVPNPKEPVSESLTNLRKLPALYEQTERDMNVLHILDSDTTPEDVIDGQSIRPQTK